MFRLLLTIIIAFAFIGPTTGSDDTSAQIVCDDDASWIERFAAQEVRRYVYLRTGILLTICKDFEQPSVGNLILVGTKHRPIVTAHTQDDTWRTMVEKLAAEQYAVKTISHDDRSVVLLVGGDGVGTLYAAYRFAEQLGVRFYLHGDVVPDERIGFKLPKMNDVARPLFKQRGIQPFHDFPEGPDWWDADAYKAVLGQLPKLRMNFFGLHTYPEGPVGPEPAVWIGLPDEVATAGTVRASYPSRHFTTSNVTSAWGYRPQKTSDYAFGAAAMYDRDDYGAEYMRDTFPWNQMTREQSNALFNRFAMVLRDSFTFGRKLGVKTCVGTETPLIVPKLVQERLAADGKSAKNAETVQKIYEGMFQRIMAAYPIDYYWLWTPEGWTWREVQIPQIEATLADFQAIQKAADAVKAPFQLATCGWVLGPSENPALFDRVLPKDWPVSCINRNVGHDPVEPGFADVRGRPQWAIPWLEDDPAMIIPQLWVGRMRKDAADALRYGCDGLLGIHWRTRILGPNVLALAQACWSQDGWKTPDVDKDPPKLEGSFNQRREQYTPWRAVQSDDFYKDWAIAQFGTRAGIRIAPLFAELDCRLPRPSDWVHGPGGIVADVRPWARVREQYAFVEELRSLEPLIRGAGNRERFQYWLANFRYLRALGQVNCTWAELNRALESMKEAKDGSSRKQLAIKRALPLRVRLIRELTNVQKYLLDTVTTKGAMGTVTNWQQHVFPMLLDPSEKAITSALGKALPANATLPRTYPGTPRMFVPVVRTALFAGEPLQLEVVVLGAKPVVATFLWRPLGAETFKSKPLTHITRGVFRAELAANQMDGDFEYYVEIAAEGGLLRFPTTAPDLNQTVVLIANAE